MAVTKRTRYEVLRRDGHACRYCGAMAPDVKLTIDHVVPVALGGGDDPSNLVTACRDCNAGKSSSAPDGAIVEDVSALTVAFAAALRQAAQEMVAGSPEEAAYVAAWEAAWCSGTYLIDDRPDGWRDSIVGFQRAGLPVETLIEGIHRARRASTVTSRNRFRYMCGFGWKKVTDLQDRAKEIAAQSSSTHADDGNDDAESLRYYEYAHDHGVQAQRRALRIYVVGDLSDPADPWAVDYDPALAVA